METDTDTDLSAPATPLGQEWTERSEGSVIAVCERRSLKRGIFEIETPTQYGRKRTHLDNESIARDKITKARNLLIDAAQLVEGEKQSEVLDLLEIVREYLDKGSRPIATTTKILATQVASLERATRKITERTRQAEPTKSASQRLFSEVVGGPDQQGQTSD